MSSKISRTSKKCSAAHVAYMELDANDIELVEKYVANALMQSEQKLLDEKMKDKLFSEQFRLQENVIRSVRALHEQELKAEFKHLLASKRHEEHNLNKRYFYWAAAAVLVGLLSMFIFRSVNLSNDSLFASYYKPYPVLATTRSESRAVEEAFIKYQEENYADAASLLQSLIQNGTGQFSEPYLQLLLGNCYINTNRIEEALLAFKKVMDSDDAILAQHAKWYYALALLKEQKIKQSQEILNEIKNSNSIYSKNAASLLAKLNS